MKHLYPILFILMLVWSCKPEPVEPDDPNNPADTTRAEVERLNIVRDPSGYAPLSAELELRATEPVAVRVRVEGKNGPTSDAVHTYPELRKEHLVPILGLYPETNNTIYITTLDENGDDIETNIWREQTPILPGAYPEISINRMTESEMSEGYNLVSYFGHNGQFFPSRPFMFDQFGDIRWYFHFEDHPELSNLFFDGGINRLANGNYYFGNRTAPILYELDVLGNTINTWPIDGYEFHHHLFEKPNGNLLATVHEDDAATEEDIIIELDRNSGNIINVWDLKECLDQNRRAWPTTFTNQDVDWFHANGLEIDEATDAIIVSGRTQGTVKLTPDNEIVWILAPHKGWLTNPRGEDLNQFLLQPLDAQGNPITDSLVLNGEQNHPDFEWAWYQHGPIILPDGNLLLFDNGDNRNYVGMGPYSRAVIYKIDEVNRTIQQVWSFGKDLGPAYYSVVVSKAWYDEVKENVLFTAGAVRYLDESYGKVVEVHRTSGEIVFEATIKPPITPFNIVFHNVQRLPLYP